MTQQDIQSLDRQTAYINITRGAKFALGLFLVHVILIAVDIRRWVLAGGDVGIGYRMLFVLHVILETGLGAFLLVVWRTGPKSPSEATLFHQGLWVGLSAFVLLISALISVFDQAIHGEITVYVIAALAIAVAGYTRLRYSLPIYAAVYIVFLIGITLMQPDQDALVGHYINGSLLTLVSVVLSKTINDSHAKNYLNQLIIQRQKAELERQNREDSLTHLYNRRYVDLQIEQEFRRAVRYRRPLAVALADLDWFKRVNDEFSHQVGDQVLVIAAGILRDTLRSVDIVARYGGEEFLMVLPETALANARRVCEKSRAAIEEYPWHEVRQGLRVTISFGIAEVGGHETASEAIATADRKLYEAKNSGRNRVAG
jgi:diguanylate cyclase (GGDEF)-like protein